MVNNQLGKGSQQELFTSNCSDLSCLVFINPTFGLWPKSCLFWKFIPMACMRQVPTQGCPIIWAVPTYPLAAFVDGVSRCHQSFWQAALGLYHVTSVGAISFKHCNGMHLPSSKCRPMAWVPNMGGGNLGQQGFGDSCQLLWAPSRLPSAACIKCQPIILLVLLQQFDAVNLVLSL